MKMDIFITRSCNRFNKSNKPDDISVSVSVQFLGWTSVKNLIPHPPPFHLSSKPGFCMWLTLNSTKTYCYKRILCFCLLLKYAITFPDMKPRFYLNWTEKGALFIPGIAKWRQVVSSFSSDSSGSHKSQRHCWYKSHCPPHHILIGGMLSSSELCSSESFSHFLHLICSAVYILSSPCCLSSSPRTEWDWNTVARIIHQ